MLKAPLVWPQYYREPSPDCSSSGTELPRSRVGGRGGGRRGEGEGGGAVVVLACWFEGGVLLSVLPLHFSAQLFSSSKASRTAATVSRLFPLVSSSTSPQTCWLDGIWIELVEHSLVGSCFKTTTNAKCVCLTKNATGGCFFSPSITRLCAHRQCVKDEEAQSRRSLAASRTSPCKWLLLRCVGCWVVCESGSSFKPVWKLKPG